MISWLATVWRALVALLAFRKGEASGRADQRQADIAAANTTAQEITHAEDTAPAGVDDTVRLLRDHDRPV